MEQTLQMMIETCADIANHIVSDRGMRAPTGYADTFSVMVGECRYRSGPEHDHGKDGEIQERRRPSG